MSNDTSRRLSAFFEDGDIILTPTMAVPTPLVGRKEYLTISDNPSVYDWFDNLWRIFSYTPIANLCGLPGISLPMAQLENGLPLGIHALARQGNDGLLLQLGAQIERHRMGNGTTDGGLLYTYQQLTKRIKSLRLIQNPVADSRADSCSASERLPSLRGVFSSSTATID